MKERNSGITVRYDFNEGNQRKGSAAALAPAAGAGKGRNRFVIAALEEKISRQNLDEWKPKTKRGQRLAALLEKGKLERAPGLDGKAIVRELMERKGRYH